jgi:hypothetical protein
MKRKTGEPLDRSGLKDDGYHDKRGQSTAYSATPRTMTGKLNHLGPGPEIENQDGPAQESAKRLGKLKTMTMNESGYYDFPGSGGHEG